MYEEAEKEIRDFIINKSNEYELAKKDTVAILTYLIHDIMSIKENVGQMEKVVIIPCEKCGSTEIVQTGDLQTCQKCWNSRDIL